MWKELTKISDHVYHASMHCIYMINACIPLFYRLRYRTTFHGEDPDHQEATVVHLLLPTVVLLLVKEAFLV